MEGYPRGPEISQNTTELLHNPEQVFDSDLDKARREAEETAERIRRNEGLGKRNGGVEIDIGQGPKPAIKIIWAKQFDQDGVMLSLDPISEGTGTESGVLAYRGRYGLAGRNKSGDFELTGDPNKRLSLEKLFQTPEGIELLVRPTVSRWAVGEDETSMLFGNNARTLFMGLGFLLLGEKGHKWMHIGMHEAGHLPRQPDENIAWRTANTNYARLYQGDKVRIREVVEGVSHGRFDILERPVFYGDLTIGRIMKYGLVSHALAGNAIIPPQWEKQSGRIMADFGRKITEAQMAFDNLLR